MKALKYFLITFVVLASVIAAVTNTFNFTNNTGTLDVALYNCGSDTMCSNPSNVFTRIISGPSFTFERPTSTYHAEYLFKQGYAPKAYIASPTYTGTDTITFNRYSNCHADILNLVISDSTPNAGDNVRVSTKIESAFTKAPNTPIYEPSQYRDWYDADTQIRIFVYNPNDQIVFQTTQNKNIYRDQFETVEFMINTAGFLQGTYKIVVETSVNDEICSSTQTQEDIIYFTIEGSSYPQCSDNVDNDGDGLIDYPNDPGCTGPTDNDESNNLPVYQCNDGIDNDGDGLIDYPNDPGCYGPTDDSEYNTPPVYQCSDNVDNDGDGLIDYPNDPGCTGPTDNDESNNLPVYQCNDGIDNDGDGLIDYPNDPGCYGPTDDSEYNNGNNQAPNVNFLTNNVNRCRNQNYIYNNYVASDSDGIIVSYQWDFNNDGIIDSTAVYPSHTFTQLGTYLVRLTVRDNGGLTDTDTITVNVINCNEDNDNGNSGGDKEHDLTIEEISVEDIIYVGNELSIDLKLKNSGDYDENNLIAIVYVDELGLFTSVNRFSLDKDTSIWKHLILTLPEEVKSGEYTLKVKFYNTDASDIKYDWVNVKDKEVIFVESYSTDKGQWSLSYILKILFLSLAILLLLLGGIIILRKIVSDK